MRIGKLSLAALVLSIPLASGCADDDHSKTRRDRDHDGIADRYDRHPDRADRGDDVIGRDRVRDRDLDRPRDRDRDRRGLDDIPRDAVRVEEGEGHRLRYRAEHDGRVYVYDEDDDRVVYTGKLYRDEDFLADPERDVLSVNGKRLDDINLRAAHRYRVYFMRN
jgi:hypothetical protein